MGESRYARYVISDPKLVTELAHHNFTEISGYTFPDPVYLDRDTLKEANTWLDIVWIWEIPHPPDLLGAHAHPFDEIVLLIGSNPHDLDDLGGEIEWSMGEGGDAERFVIDRTTAIYVPRGLVHGPMNFLRIDRPVLNVAIGLDCGDYQ
ncbi:MAG TPA: hypothetical protein VJ787_00530 [Thermoleophilia bacterium]|nr:hypothetical protein [Thermoleophilia bacterium]